MNYKFIKFFIVAILLLVVSAHVHAQQAREMEDDSTMIYDQEDSAGIVEQTTLDTVVKKKTFDNGNDSTQKWKNSPDFAYIKNLDSLLRKGTGLKADTVSIDKNTGKKRAASDTSEAISNGLLNSFPVKIFFWAVALLFIGFIIYKLFFTGGLFSKSNTNVASGETEDAPLGLNEYAEYNVLIKEAEQKKDFNLSTRYLYLQTLRRLGDRELIQFSADKTNYEYVKVLSGRPYQQAFASLTLNYEYVWYGKFVISENRYGRLKEEFISFNKKM
ncbi:MAG: DUF4129 domain-containing protein [Bacteroidota bacterium]|nr:DUF4129 domain-containing protein [Bacteroidota bacterium]